MKTRMAFFNGRLSFLLGFVMLTLVGCGGEAEQPEDTGASSSPAPSSEEGPQIGNQVPSPNPGPTGTVDNFAPTTSVHFTLTGELGSKPVFPAANESQEVIPPTDSILKIRIKAGPADRLDVPGSNGTMPYGCISYRLQVNARTVDTGPLKVPGGDNSGCMDAPSHKTYDFKDQLGGLTSPTVKVSNAKYDFYCKLFDSCLANPWSFDGYSGWIYRGECSGMVYSSRSLYCPLRGVFQTHTVTGELEIQTNNTPAVGSSGL